PADGPVEQVDAENMPGRWHGVSPVEKSDPRAFRGHEAVEASSVEWCDRPAPAQPASAWQRHKCAATRGPAWVATAAPSPRRLQRPIATGAPARASAADPPAPPSRPHPHSANTRPTSTADPPMAG